MKPKVLFALAVAVVVYTIQDIYLRPHMMRNALFHDARWIIVEGIAYLAWIGSFMLALIWLRESKAR